MSDAPRLEIGYWRIRGLGAPMRMLLAYAGADFVDTRYAGSGPDANRDMWFKQRKPALAQKNPLVGLPYVVDGDVVVSQSNACLLYLGRKFNLAGSTPAEVLLCEQVLAEVFDLRNAAVGVTYPSDFSPEGCDRQLFLDNLRRHFASAAAIFDKLEAHMAFVGKRFSCADTPLACDFPLWEMLDQHERMRGVNGEASPLATRPCLARMYKDFRELPQLQKYFDSDAYALPVNNLYAHFC
eukprot:TRINITY_DN4071_c0_g1_i1.p1 TRINITY_DN4071_c0_g1~~TRINITY_DN4071_c0_g1_i1.p1  ORF type:complete len:239 (+),score=91.14 TRINITY_DN4071_c0_g1_i1:103-819(+)